MDFKDTIKKIGERISRLKDSIQTEEATKTALILPFLNALGYDVFDPHEVSPEFISDIGTKKGEKVDYAIMKDGQPIILIECKHHNQSLTLHDNQLLRYFHVTKARFGILTNGVIYRFYTDLIETNKMDQKPFLEINLTDPKDAQIEELKKFHKSYFDVESILSTASELKYMGELKPLIAQEMADPSDALVRYIAKQVYPGLLHAKMFDYFKALIKKGFQQIISDQITDRLKSALTIEEQQDLPSTAPTSAPEPAIETKKEPNIVTTAEEMESYYIVRAILRSTIDGERIFHRDAQSYFAILLDDNNRKPLCRMYMNSQKKYIAFLDESRKEVKYEIQSLNNIYDYSDHLLKSLTLIEGGKPGKD
ncbi:type I restriction endonuclease [Larkinella rosea]|uniref:Restriction endonuclease n=1 Tax=Larkinella rosea TaxID=2025312 RepID=A0A3P1C0F5_9BACT|nr:type I restriction endonuclease [Larkinella rosea]RRB06890.1 restriction endonuclease [Larkinella rosea]